MMQPQVVGPLSDIEQPVSCRMQVQVVRVNGTPKIRLVVVTPDHNCATYWDPVEFRKTVADWLNIADAVEAMNAAPPGLILPPGV